MILRRITQHVKEQNWFAVGLDFFIVVIGVFIGIQVANWNEVRAGEERLRSQLVSFQTELIMARSDLDDLEDYYAERSNAAAELRMRLETEEPPLSEGAFNRLAYSAIRDFQFNILYRNFEELSSSGALAMISDGELRDLVFRWDNELAAIRNLDVTGEEFRATAILPSYSLATVYGNAYQQSERYEDIITRAERFEFDIDAIRANLEFDNALALRHLLMLQKLERLRSFRVTSEELIAALEKSAP
ncbi:MAG: hypothetical protein AAGH87_08060 [Pseudomonadota bacterium]